MISTKEQIKNLSYTDFIAFIRETNRCPGGKDTIRKVVQNSFLSRKSKVLEIGSNTGFTSIEISHLIKCEVEGIDISQNCVKEASRKLETDVNETKKKVHFQIGSAYNIPFSENTFDLVIAGGATSFMEEKQKAVQEYLRVTKPWGFISVTQLFYKECPPTAVVENVSKAIGVKIKPWNENDWLSVFNKQNQNLELYFYEKNELFSRSQNCIDEYISYFMNKPHIKDLPLDVQKTIEKKWKDYINIFNENQKYLGYFIAIFRKTLYEEEPELFIRKNNEPG